MKDTPPTATAAAPMIEIELSDCADKDALLLHLARTLHFPAWFGDNWDALADALDDLSWLQPPPARILIRGLAAFAARDPESARILGEILATVTGENCDRGFLLELAPNAPPAASRSAAASPPDHDDEPPVPEA